MSKRFFLFVTFLDHLKSEFKSKSLFSAKLTTVIKTMAIMSTNENGAKSFNKLFK